MKDLNTFFDEASYILEISNLGLLGKNDESSRVAIRLAVELTKLRQAFIGLTNINMHLIARMQVLEQLLQIDSKTVDGMVDAISSEVDVLNDFKYKKTLKALHERYAGDLSEDATLRGSGQDASAGDLSATGEQAVAEGSGDNPS